MLISALAIPVYSICLLLVAVCALFRLNTVDRAGKILCVWIWLALIKEVAGWYAGRYYVNNLPVYNLSAIIEFALIIFYFHFSLFQPLRRHTAIGLASTGLILGIGNLLFLQPLTRLNTNFLFLECVVTICLCLYALYYRLIRADIRPSDDFHFLTSGIFLLYKCGSLWTWWIYSQADLEVVEEQRLWYVGALLTNTLAYLALGWILFFYSNFRKSHV